MNEYKQLALDFSESIAAFDRDQEKIGRQYSVVYPVRTVYPETQRYKLAEQVRRRERQFIESGVTGLVESPEDAEAVAMVVAKLKYGAHHALFHDLGVGIYTALTRPNSPVQFYDVRHLRDTKSGKIEKTVVTISGEGIVKLALGPLVNDNGRAITGAGPIVGEQKDRLREVLTGKRAEPIAAASITRKREDGSKIDAIVYGKPIVIDKFTTNDAFAIALDHSFFPVIETDGSIKAKELHVHHVAGLFAVASFGAYILKKKAWSADERESLPTAPEVHKLLLYLQAAAEMTVFAPTVVQQSNDRFNFRFRRKTTIRELRPGAINSQGRIRWSEFSQFVANGGRIYGTAIDELGILDQLHPDTLVPATDKGAEFPDHVNKEIVYIKADRVRKAIQDLRRR